nr:hypothetical protein [Williamsia herbipolensis]
MERATVATSGSRSSSTGWVYADHLSCRPNAAEKLAEGVSTPKADIGHAVPFIGGKQINGGVHPRPVLPVQ